MAQPRYARLDVQFPFKRTANKLLDELGPYGPLVFIYLILAAKDGSPPGSFSYPNDAVGWQKLGLDGREIPFTLDEFFGALGRMKQSSRRRNGRVWNAYLTRYGEWQKESRRYEEAVRKSSKRRETAADTERTPQGTRSGRKGGPSSRTRTTPTPREKGTNPRAKGTTPRQNGTAPRDLGTNPRKLREITCPECGVPKKTERSLTEHLEYIHGILPAETPA